MFYWKRLHDYEGIYGKWVCETVKTDINKNMLY